MFPLTTAGEVLAVNPNFESQVLLTQFERVWTTVVFRVAVAFEVVFEVVFVVVVVFVVFCWKLEEKIPKATSSNFIVFEFIIRKSI